MAVVKQQTNIDLTTAGSEFVFTTTFGATARVGEVLFTVDPTTVANEVVAQSNTPNARGIQENFEIWIVDSGNPLYNCKIATGSLNGKAYLNWGPVGQALFLASTQEIKVVLKNVHQVGHVYITVVAQTGI